MGRPQWSCKLPVGWGYHWPDHQWWQAAEIPPGHCRWQQGQAGWHQGQSRSGEGKNVCNYDKFRVNVTYLFNKLHNLLLCGFTCNKVINISDNIHTDAAGQVILGGTEDAGHEAGEQDEYSLHCVVCGEVEVLTMGPVGDFILKFYLSMSGMS